MLTKTKLVLAAALLAGTASVAAAQGFDSNLANRYPALADPTAPAAHAATHQDRTLRSAPVGLHAPSARPRSLTTRPVALPRTQLPTASDAWIDRASQVFDGGAG
jgi:hypothetical protein